MAHPVFYLIAILFTCHQAANSEENMNPKTLKKLIAITCTAGVVKYIAAGIILAKLIDIGHKSKPKAK
jgi:hypothetical protein